MANLPSLPPEIVIKIAKCIRSFDSPLVRAETYPRKLESALKLETTSLLSLARACKALKSLVEPEACYNLAVFNLKPLEEDKNAYKLPNLIRLLEERRDVRGWVRQIHVHFLSSGGILPDVWDSEGNITPPWQSIANIVGSGFESCLRQAIEAVPGSGAVEKWRGYLLFLLLLKLPDVRGLSVAATPRTFRFAAQLVDTYATRNPEKCLSLSRLTSLAAGFCDPSIFDWKGHNYGCNLWKSFMGLNLFPKLSEVWVSNLLFDAMVPHCMPKQANDNITTITLRDVSSTVAELREAVQQLRNLRAFKYLVIDIEDSGLSCGKVVKALEQHVSTLKKFCYYSSFFFVLEEESLSIFKDMSKLEHLFLDLSYFAAMLEEGHQDDDEVNGVTCNSLQDFEEHVLTVLPPSLRRLHLAGESRRILNGMQWLAENCKPTLLPHLREVAFEYMMLSDPSAEQSLALTCEAFAKIGVRASKEVDTMLGF
ncbi:hypothetical protein RB213_012057 [Colletotrichum asianum]|uniref:Uncharacterized protein n=1 Tax=Colletotrichum asianum TaxID=702518 RepID=A0A8H3ZLW7_9PEZI|nr:hypothetical protein GQ607_016358 [Colletotrichum asianum]